MGELNKLPNIGKALEKRLNEVDIVTKDELLSLGSKEAFKKLREVDGGACLNSLCALEGAVQGIRWHYLPKEVKNDLKEFLNSLEV
ncbi:MAG: TfoX/Sxy family protein [Maledivibacter sp.]|jgi:DNA transformation protein|nr:TfoX/Sxy family protein [Maledivibacter sp.]